MVEHSERPATSAVFAALGDPVRCDLVVALRTGPATVGELAARFPISLQAVSRHIGVLESAGVLRRERIGRSRVVTLDAAALARAAAWLAPPRRDAAYDGLDALLAEHGHGDAPPIRVHGTATTPTTTTPHLAKERT